DLPDIPLWAVWAVQQYAKAFGRDTTRELYGAFLARAVEYIMSNTHPNLHFDEETAMLSADGTKTPISWMNATHNGVPVIPRSGLLVEFNALWYNLLRFAADTLERDDFADVAERLRQPFIDTFLNDGGYLYDYVDNRYASPEVRPNMAVAIGLDYSPLDRRQRKSVLDVVTRELLTPKGLRTLSPKSYAYRPFYEGDMYEREETLHKGPARPWLMGFYAEAYFKVFGLSGLSYIDRMLIGFEDDMSQRCIGSLSQLYDGNPPFQGRGAVSHATNVAEVLRTVRLMKRYNQ
ncbi:MAG: amylo-alpha-1,6-glucosidase, partial [Muribaculaceae bacterium]